MHAKDRRRSVCAGNTADMLQVVEDGYEFFAKRQLVTLFSAPNYCGEVSDGFWKGDHAEECKRESTVADAPQFDNAGAMMSVDDTLLCSFQVSLLEDSGRWAFKLMRITDSKACREEGAQVWLWRCRRTT